MAVTLIALLVISNASSLHDDFGMLDGFDEDFNKIDEQELGNDQVEQLEAIHKLRKKYLYSSPKV